MTVSTATPSPGSARKPRNLSIQTQPEQLGQPIVSIPPSPSRSRLDPQYSARLSQQSDPLAVSSCSSPRKRSSKSAQSSFFFSSPVGGTMFSTPERRSGSRTPLASPSPSRASSINAGEYVSSAASTPTGGASQSEIVDTGYSDRFIPSRVSSNLSFSLMDADRGHRQSASAHQGRRGNSSDSAAAGDSNQANVEGGANGSSGRGADGSSQPMLNMLLRSELLDVGSEPSSPNVSMSLAGTPQREGSNLFRYQNPRQTDGYYSGFDGGGVTSVVKPFNISPVGSASSHRLLASPQKRKRRIAKVPFKVLDAPSLQDDFYLNLVDWSSANVLAVGLGSCVYLWSACTSKVTKLCDLAATEDIVTSVSWTQRGTHLAVGTNRGEVQLWDTIKCKKIRTMGGHSARVGTLSWNGPTLASGSRDRLIYLRDVRIQQPFTARLAAHKQEVCGLKWSFDEPSSLASGGNDNKLLVWDIKNHSQPLHRFAEHTAAVKAIAWSPHQHGLLASGGGTADRCIRFWNTMSGTSLSCIDTGSQVCNLAWSKNCHELVSTHGYSLNQIVVWRYPSMTKVATLTGHTYRVLYLAMSPDGSTIVTGAGDETLRFWQVFPGPRSHDKSSANGLLFPSTPGSVVR